MTLFESVKNAIRAGVTALWSAGFAAAGRSSLTGAGPIHTWHSTGNERVLVIAPHPDDEAVGCAGTILCHKQAGDSVGVVYVSDGRRSRALDLDPTAMARCREAEAKLAAERLKLDQMIWLGLPEGDWTFDQLTAELQPALADFAPTLIYAPSRVDFHPEHHRVAYALAGLLPIHAACPVRIYQIQLPLTRHLTNLVADVSAWLSEIEQVFQAYASQRYSTERTLRSRQYAAHYYHCGRLAEEFWELPAKVYRSLHNTDPTDWPTAPFRSLRYQPLTDPLAYWRGSAERRRLSGLANQRLSTATPQPKPTTPKIQNP